MKKPNIKYKLVALVSISLGISACNDNSSGDIMSKITASENTGKIPVLNRDTTLAGPDVNGNGVRDDIDTYVDGLSDTPEQKAALKQMSAAFTATITADIYDKEALRQASDKISRAIQCLALQYSKDGESSTLRIEKGQIIRKYTINTPERFKAYFSYNKASSGSVSESFRGDTCD